MPNHSPTCQLSAFMRLLVGSLLPLAGSTSAAESVAPPEDPLAFRTEARPILEKHCFGCHGPDQQEMGLNFAAFTDLPSILNGREKWRKAREALQTGEMPPADSETQLSAEERKKLIAWIQQRVETIDRQSPIYRDPGPPLVRQLTRTEYNNTINDLIGFNFDAAGSAGIRGEEVADGYVNTVGNQVMHEARMEKSFRAAFNTLQAIFDEPNRKQNLKAILIAQPGEGVSPRDAARKVLERFVRRAYRRPAETAEIDRLLVIVEGALAEGDSYEKAIRKALKPVLVSPHFLFRPERDQGPAGSAEAYRITNHELATRLSYFLWATMPDEKLAALADAGTLDQPDVLEAEVKRMLADPKARALTEQFALQWLHINDLRRALPDRNHFPAFTQSLKGAMEAEIRTFFDKLRTDDGRILDLLDADYTYVNEELAQHYGLTGVKGPQMQRVALPVELHRGGLIGMSGVLTMTSHTNRTKPTARGKWILEVVLGTPPANPPANVSNFKPQPKDKPVPKSFREKLDQHATEASCAACHKKIDPLGFALENFDAVGLWRDQVGGEPVDNVGQLPGGKEFRGVDGLRQVIRERQDLFVRNLVVQMKIYALGRNLDYRDELAVVEITEALAKEDYRFSALVRGIVTCRPFLYRRNEVVSASAAAEQK